MGNQVTLYLSAGGDHFKLRMDIKEKFREVNIKTDPIHPYLKKAVACKSYEEVLAFLEGVEKVNCKTYNFVIEFFLRIFGYRQDLNCSFYHEHHPRYPMHSLNIGFGLVKGVAHQCPVAEMIKFVKMRIKERNTPHAFFDKIEKAITASALCLHTHSCTPLPIIGAIPALGMIGFGITQTIAGLAISMLSAIPAYGVKSENAQIVFKRSFEHIIRGPFCTVVGIMQAMRSIPNRFIFAAAIPLVLSLSQKR